MKRLQEIEARKAEIRSLLQSDNEVDLDALKNELDSLSSEQRSIKERHELANSIQVGKIVARGLDPDEDEPKEDVADSAEYRSAYLKNLMGKELNDAEKRAMTTASNSVGAVVPTTTMNKIVEKLKQAGVILPLVTTLNIPSNVKMRKLMNTFRLRWKRCLLRMPRNSALWLFSERSTET